MAIESEKLDALSRTRVPPAVGPPAGEICRLGGDGDAGAADDDGADGGEDASDAFEPPGVARAGGAPGGGYCVPLPPLARRSASE